MVLNSEKQRTLHSLVIEIELEIHSNAPKQQPESCLEQRVEFPVSRESTPLPSPFPPGPKSCHLELKSSFFFFFFFFKYGSLLGLHKHVMGVHPPLLVI
jgi:hypothetical protein